MIGLAWSLIAALLTPPFGPFPVLIAALPSNLILALAGFSLFVGQILCLRVPAGTRSRPLAAICLAARILAFGLSALGTGFLWDGDSVSGRGRDTALLIAFSLLLGSWAVSLVAEFLFLAFLKRVGQFLEDGNIILHARRAAWILAGYAVIALALGAAGIALAYQSVLGEIAAWKVRFPKADAQPLSWLLTRISGVLLSFNDQPLEVAQSRLIATSVQTFFWMALGVQYRAALSAAKATIDSGLFRGKTP